MGVVGVASVALACAAGALGQTIGPSTATAPYLLPRPGWEGKVTTVSILTVGDSVGGYRMVGVPDGLGAFWNGDGTFSLLMDHELAGELGVVRAHGSTGAFVSRWMIDGGLNVLAGRDHNTGPGDVHTWNGSGYIAGTTIYRRLCSADLAAPSAYRFGTLGTDARLFLNGEEDGEGGRAFAHIVTGPGTNETWQLPRMGLARWENLPANPTAGVKTIVVGMDDASSNGQVYVYVGSKTAAGNDIERAGLTNGSLYGVRVVGMPQEQRSAPPPDGTRFELFGFGNVENFTVGELNDQSIANGVTSWHRPEDGAWDARPGRERDFYFVTCDRYNSGSIVGRSRLWRLRFDDVANPEAGGVVTCLVEGTEGAQVMDNLCIDTEGRILIQEDIGGEAALGKIWLYDIETGGFAAIAEHNPVFFAPGGANLLTLDEESSGIIDAGRILGRGWFLLDVQAHHGIGGELVQGGQLLAMYVRPSLVPGTAGPRPATPESVVERPR